MGQTKAAIESAIKFTPIDNSDPSWNCQNWVGDALKKLSDRQWITNGAFSEAIDAMGEVVVDAPDEAWQVFEGEYTLLPWVLSNSPS